MNWVLKLRFCIVMCFGVGDDKFYYSILFLFKLLELFVDVKVINLLIYVEFYCLMVCEDNKWVLFIVELVGCRDSFLELLKCICI